MTRATSEPLATSCSSQSPGSAIFPAAQRWLEGLLPRGLRSPRPAEPLTPEGSGEEVVLQGFNWESWRAADGGRDSWWEHLRRRVDEVQALGFSTVWLPPPTQSVSPQGYMPCDLYDLDGSYYGSEAELRRLVAALRARGIKPVADVVLNHRCASARGPEGVYNAFGGRLAWDATAIVGDDERFAGRGGTRKATAGHAFFEAAPNLDHAHPGVKSDLVDWLRWLRRDVGFEGWRLDFVRGFDGAHVRDYVAASEAAFAVGEFWDGLRYDADGRPSHCQAAHRARLARWVCDTGGAACAFDITTKGVLHAALEHGEFWRLRDAEGRAPGLIGFWPARAVTFIENHDTGSTQGHWRFPAARVGQGYAYILTHPGTPCVFYDHAFLWEGGLREAVAALVAARRRARVHCRSVLRILRAEQGLYAAEVDGRLAVKLGHEPWQPAGPGWAVAAWGDQWAVWARD